MSERNINEMVLMDKINQYHTLVAKESISLRNDEKKHGIIFTTWPISYLEENNFLDILGLDIKLETKTLQEFHEKIIENILNIEDSIGDPGIFKQFFNKEINYIHLRHILYKKGDDVLYLDLKFDSILDKYIIITVDDITDSIEDKFMLEELINDNQLLVKEVHHRVKNNLQILLSLISLQERFKKSDASIKEYLKLSVSSMALMHSQLYSENLTKISTKQILIDLKSKCESLYNHENVSFDFTSLDDVKIIIEKVNPILLMLDELIVNSMNRFDENQGNKVITCQFMEDNGSLLIYFKDNAIDKNKFNDDLSNMLIDALISQADAEKEEADKGFDYKIRMELDK